MNLKTVAMTATVKLLIVSAPALAAQVLPGSVSAGHLLPEAPPSVQAASPARGQVLREIDDPSTGDRWVLLRNLSDPAAPARLVLTTKDMPAEESPASALAIHAGDTLIVEDHTALADVRLEAVALSRATAGAEFTARLKIGGKVVHAVAVAPGKAVLSVAGTGIEAWR
jgi:hypothetical protein